MVIAARNRDERFFILSNLVLTSNLQEVGERIEDSLDSSMEYSTVSLVMQLCQSSSDSEFALSPTVDSKNLEPNIIMSKPNSQMDMECQMSGNSRNERLTRNSDHRGFRLFDSSERR